MEARLDCPQLATVSRGLSAYSSPTDSPPLLPEDDGDNVASKGPLDS